VIPPGEWTCEEVAGRIHAYAFGRLGGGDAASIEHHLRGCASCESIMAEIGHDTAEVLEATGLRDLPEDLIDLIIAAAAQQGAGQKISPALTASAPGASVRSRWRRT
jgi:hypothetical protein